MNTTETNQSSDELITIAGGIEIEVTKQDGSKEQVKVRQIPISKIQPFVFAVAWGNMAEEIELACDKPKGWPDSITTESAVTIEQKARELNLPFVEAWSRSQARWKEAMAADKIAVLEQKNAALEQKVATLTALRLGSSAPSSPTD